MVNVFHDFDGFKNRHRALAHIQLKVWASDRDLRGTPVVGLLSRVHNCWRCIVECQAALSGGLRVESAVVIVADLGEVSHSLREKTTSFVGTIVRPGLDSAVFPLRLRCDPRVEERVSLGHISR